MGLDSISSPLVLLFPIGVVGGPDRHLFGVQGHDRLTLPPLQRAFVPFPCLDFQARDPRRRHAARLPSLGKVDVDGPDMRHMLRQWRRVR